MAADLVVRRVPEYGWAVFYRKSGDKVEGDENGPWWPTRKTALAHRAALTASQEAPRG